MTDILDLGDLDVAEVHAQLFEQQERDDGLRPEAHERRQETLKQTTRRGDGSEPTDAPAGQCLSSHCCIAVKYRLRFTLKKPCGPLVFTMSPKQCAKLCNYTHNQHNYTGTSTVTVSYFLGKNFKSQYLKTTMMWETW